MPRPDPIVLALAGCAFLAGCNDTRDLAPLSPSTPWQIQSGEVVAKQPGGQVSAGPDSTSRNPPRFDLPRDPALPWPGEPAGIDPGHTYSLAELIDIAQRRSKETRVAWEQARQAAIGVGIARAALLPDLAIDALGGYTRQALPFPTQLVPRGYITSNGEAIFPEVVVRYLLLDFGGRAAAVEGAKQTSFAANVTFNGAHQRLIFAVSRAYFMLDGVDAQLRAAQQSLANARVLQDSAKDRYGHGVGTVTDVALARRGVAQANFDVAQATSAQHAATYALLQTLDLPPTATLRVADSSTHPMQRDTARTVDGLMRDALVQRPDLLAGIARLRASDAGIAAARSAFLPKLSVSANVQANIGQIEVNGSPYQRIAQPQAGVFLRFDWPLYQGGLQQNRLRLAESQRAQAEDTLQQNSTQALREVAMAYDQVQTGLTQYDSATALQAASQTAFDAASDAYAHGVGSLTDATNAQTALAAARASVAQAHSQSLVNAAALAFATGSLTSSAAPSIAPAAP